MKIVGWATNVNKIIIDQTSLTVGEGGFLENKNESGYEERSLTSLASPDTFNVVMDFDWYKEDKNGLTEFDRFKKWYKFVHQRGTNPFEFPSITKENVMGKTKTCLYKIISSFNGTKSGYSQRVTMTWKEVFNGVISIPDIPSKLASIYPEKNIIHLIYDGPLETQPLLQDISASYSKDGKTWSDLEAEEIIAFGDRDFGFTFKELEKGNYIIKVNGITNTLVV